jgi:hypothetical protein
MSFSCRLQTQRLGWSVRWWCLVLGAIVLAGCGGGARPPAPAASGTPVARWTVFRHLPGVVDLAGPRDDGSFLVAAAGRLLTMGPGGTLRPFAGGPGGYRTATGTEPYLAVTSGVPVRGNHCSFRINWIFALEPGVRPGVMVISPQGRARWFASLPAGLFPSGIAFDGTGRFGHRLLVTVTAHGRTKVFGIGCDGRVSTVAAFVGAAEGGIVVAPAGFGPFGGDLIAPDEGSGLVYAVAPSGREVTLASSGLPAGGDIGVDSAGFVPPGAAAAYLADRFSKGSRHPGDDAILRLSLTGLARPGDLLVATESGARTIDVRCAASCAVRYLAAGPAIAHAEGHIMFASW